MVVTVVKCGFHETDQPLAVGVVAWRREDATQTETKNCIGFVFEFGEGCEEFQPAWVEPQLRPRMHGGTAKVALRFLNHLPEPWRALRRLYISAAVA
jgi:hypothetical protein